MEDNTLPDVTRTMTLPVSAARSSHESDSEANGVHSFEIRCEGVSSIPWEELSELKVRTTRLRCNDT